MKHPILSLSIFFCLLSCGKSKEKPPASNGHLSVTNVSGERPNTGKVVFSFQVQVESPSAREIEVDYTTVDGTATAGADFVAKSGTVTIAPNAYNATIDVEVLGDSIRSADKVFYVQLSNPKNATLLQPKGTGTIISNGTYLPVDNVGYVSAESYPGYHLQWQDEFEGGTLNTAYWNYETGGNGWGNQELQYYTNSDKNSFVSSNGYLVIEATKEAMGQNQYTSARLTTQGKKEFQYGRIDIRARLAKGQGIWPALWMLGSNFKTVSWPASGEIDIMEFLGHEVNKVYGTIHYGPAGGGSISKGFNYVLPSGNFQDAFHVFSLIWDESKIQWLVDDVAYATVYQSDVTGENPFKLPFFFIFNVAVGGQWPGSPDAGTKFPQRMVVDYIRVFQK